MKTLKFELGEKDTAEALDFMKEHNEVCPNRGKYQGAIGVSYTFSFTDTSIGCMPKVECHCGESKHLFNDI